jgi:hypothetical protein
VADQPNALSRLIENPIFYAVGIAVGLIGWWFRYLEDGHLILVLIAGIIGLARWFQTRRAKYGNT